MGAGWRAARARGCCQVACPAPLLLPPSASVSQSHPRLPCPPPPRSAGKNAPALKNGPAKATVERFLHDQLVDFYAIWLDPRGLPASGSPAQRKAHRELRRCGPRCAARCA